jgi:tRNA nucleotidyltransferase (CCA-adding enzyme)
MKKINSVLKEVLQKVEPPKEDLKIINNSLKDTIQELKKRIKKQKIKAEIFIGGSFAKKTVIKKDKYDVDVFLRFDKKYTDLSKATAKLIKGIANVSVIHGSRDYFRIKVAPDFFIELVPVVKVSNPKQAQNITDLSYSHVNYIKKKVKNEKVLDEIRIAKAFCYANNCYGAESYISGFSGYALELLVYYYGSFIKFLKEMVKLDGKKEIIDIERHFKRKGNVLLDLNEAKLFSPVILIDPTFKQRNALAALSKETFERFKKAAKSFLKNPSIKAFEVKKTDLDKIQKDAKAKKQEFILVEIKTKKQQGDIAGSKLLKFYKHLGSEIERFFDVKNKGFNYNGKQAARFFIVAKSKKDLIVSGPSTRDKKSVSMFKKKHKKTFVKAGRIHARDKVNFSLKSFIDFWTNKHKKRLKEMYVSGLKIV